jgi:hypothetical protein
VVPALLADCPHPTFGEGVGARRLHRYEDGLGTDRGEDLVKGGHELRVSVPYEEAEAPATVFERAGEIAATWVAHAPVGLAVTPRMCTMRLWTSTTKST